MNGNEATILMKNLERIIKHYNPCPEERLILIKSILNEFEEKGILHHSLTDQHSLILIKNERKCKSLLRKYAHSPFPYLSNVEHFCTASGDWNPVLLSYGIKARASKSEVPNESVGSQIHLISKESLNYRCNQYLRLQYKRLNHLRNKGEISKYWNLSFKLMSHSWSFRLACLNNWSPRWYKSLSLRAITQLWKELHKILSFTTLTTQITNLWIESPKNKYRQLCIPPKAWRLYFHMLNMFLSYLFSPRLNKQEYHGFLFNRGSKSWWTSLLWNPLLTETQWIIELDLSSGFPNLNLNCVYTALKESGLIPEPLLHLIMTHLKSPQTSPVSFPTLSTFIEHMENLPWRQSNRSVPMGIGISPLLFVITQDWAFRQLKLSEYPGFHSRWYADDFSFFFTTTWFQKFLTSRFTKWELIWLLTNRKNPIISYLNNSPILQNAGLRICLQKSGWVRKFGIWIKPYRSLGLNLFSPGLKTQIFHKLTFTETPLSLRSHTRGRGSNPQKGIKSTLPQNTLLYHPSLKPNTPPLDLTSLISKYQPYFGLIMAKLYGKSPQATKPVSWFKTIKRQSLLSYLYPKANKDKNYLEKINKYNAGSKLNKLILSLVYKESKSNFNKETFPNLERVWKPQWSYIDKSIMNQEFLNPLQNSSTSINDENYFKKYSELNLTQETMTKYETLYDKMKQSET